MKTYINLKLYTKKRVTGCIVLYLVYLFQTTHKKYNYLSLQHSEKGEKQKHLESNTLIARDYLFLFFWNAEVVAPLFSKVVEVGNTPYVFGCFVIYRKSIYFCKQLLSLINCAFIFCSKVCGCVFNLLISSSRQISESTGKLHLFEKLQAAAARCMYRFQ